MPFFHNPDKHGRMVNNDDKRPGRHHKFKNAGTYQLAHIDFRGYRFWTGFGKAAVYAGGK